MKYFGKLLNKLTLVAISPLPSLQCLYSLLINKYNIPTGEKISFRQNKFSLGAISLPPTLTLQVFLFLINF